MIKRRSEILNDISTGLRLDKLAKIFERYADLEGNLLAFSICVNMEKKVFL
ncbi:MAG: hypothetical protein MRT15_12430 [archaeon YNP-LCB-003-016]|nr:hypothetical protein [Candidatus Culexarchaeum yellowstonense]